MKTKSFSLTAIYIWLFLFSLLPLGLIIIASFLSKDSQHLLTTPFTLQNYTLLFSPVFAKIMVRSVCISAVTTIICLFVAYPFSYVLVKSKHQSLLLLLIIIPFWTSSLVRTYSMLSILKFKGIINFILLKLHIIHEPLALLYSNFAVIGGLVYTLFPFMVLPLFTNMERFDFRLLEAAKDLGANRVNLFFRVFLPNTMHGIATGCLLVFLPAMTLFYIPVLLGGSRSILLGNLIQNQFLVAENWPSGSAISVVLTLTLLLFLLFYRLQPKELVN